VLSGSDLPRAFSRDKCCSCSYRFAPWKWCQLSSSFAFSLEARAKHWALHFLLLARVWLPHLQRVVTVGFEFNEKFIVWENQWDQCIGRKTFHKVPSTKNTWKNVVISIIHSDTQTRGTRGTPSCPPRWFLTGGKTSPPSTGGIVFLGQEMNIWKTLELSEMVHFLNMISRAEKIILCDS